MNKKCQIYLLLIMLLMACESVVTIDVPQEPSRLVLNSIINEDAYIEVFLSRSKYVLSNSQLEAVDGAEIMLEEDGQVIARLEANRTSTLSGVYTTDYKPKAGNTYTLKASHPDFNSVESSTTIPVVVPIHTLKYDTTVYEDSYYDYNDSLVTKRYVSLDDIWLGISDPPEEENFYEIVLYHYYQEVVEMYDEEGNYQGYDTVDYAIPVYITSDDPVVSENDFFEDSGYVGSSLLFSDEIFNGKTYTIHFEESYGSVYYSNKEQENEYLLQLRSLNKSQYQYLRSIDLQYDTEGNPFSEPAPVYNNIEGGYGIFAGYSLDAKTISLQD
ncbi:DUF4249 domain-containing protein [Porifericola rhodea]|uniref:DUF4249 domain-containing protein n=1 Tax=Porifericola rhodea TaxID=930972 RepID=UPI00266572D4|nr:DUF4249 domain-containing protein [Porifericola rhodea]WKN31727.1 DUF4249 domain-containing protein [Porifericola rhodea]